MRSLWRASLYGVVLAVVWVVLAWLYDATFHFAPLLVAAVVPLGVALAGDPPPLTRRLGGAALGALIALGATTALALGGHLADPSLLPAGGALAEAIAFSLAGAAVGLVLGLTRRRNR
jgi:hypothetical protein